MIIAKIIAKVVEDKVDFKKEQNIHKIQYDVVSAMNEYSGIIPLTDHQNNFGKKRYIHRLKETEDGDIAIEIDIEEKRGIAISGGTEITGSPVFDQAIVC